MKTKQNTIEYNRPNDKGQRWVEYPEKGLRFAGKSHDIARKHDRRRTIDHTGWFIDEYCDETVCGLVYQLPAHKGTCVYVAAISDAWGNDGALIDFSETFDDEMEAALRADRLAELYADEEREYQRVESAKMRYEDITRDIQTAWAKCREFCSEIRALNPGANVRRMLRDHVCGVRRDVQKMRRERANFEWAMGR